MNCPILWKSKLQTEVALLSTESEYCGASYALRDAIPIMNILTELKENGFDVKFTNPNVRCKVFEDNSGALEMLQIDKYHPQTKHLNVKLHHFRSYVDDKTITIHKVDTSEQAADFLTKPLPVEPFERCRKYTMGW